MKKIFLAILTMAITAFTVSSCSDDGNNASVTITYFGTLGKVDVTQASDSDFLSLIDEASAKLKLSGYNSAWEETASNDMGSTIAATVVANAKACRTYKKKVDGLTMSSLKQAIFSQHSDSLAGIGYPTAESLPLHSMQLVYYLRSASASVNIDTVTVRLNP